MVDFDPFLRRAQIKESQKFYFLTEVIIQMHCYFYLS